MPVKRAKMSQKWWEKSENNNEQQVKGTGTHLERGEEDVLYEDQQGKGRSPCSCLQKGQK